MDSSGLDSSGLPEPNGSAKLEATMTLRIAWLVLFVPLLGCSAGASSADIPASGRDQRVDATLDGPRSDREPPAHDLDPIADVEADVGKRRHE